MTDSPRGFVLGPDDGHPISLTGWEMLRKVGAADTAGALTVVEGRLAAGHPGPKAHVHDLHDECFVVLAGRMRFRIGDGFRTAGPGDLVFAGRELAHGFSNPFDEPNRYLVLLSPSGYEDYFEEIAAHLHENGANPSPEQMERMMQRYATRLAEPLADDK
ncbi:MAG TPA: cupin domain-containing protein [Actinocrinis sp.]|nr:cupin domain-containing protein [Actinocrinis sp.]